MEWSEEAYNRALKHTLYQVDRREISHDNFEERAKGFVKANENVAYFTKFDPISAEEVANQFMKQWINSPGHNANLLATELTHSGIAVYVVARENRLWYYSSQLNVSLDSPNDLFQKILKRSQGN